MANAQPVQHLISCLVENHPGVLARISGMFSARAFNIESLAVGTTADPTISRITIAVPGDPGILEQIIKQLAKIIDVIHVEDISETDHVERELMLIKVNCEGRNRSEIMQICDIFRARIVDVHSDCLIIEVSGTLNKNEAILRLFQPFGILEMTRTGRVALHRGPRRLELPAVEAEG
ncbi:MAG TPA: acetolactate synthase small subunit [Candidatus Sumerlaeota bacterium]|nr:MAG: Acetolactate synthase small subunit [candidate division BRC1 bacterium ADurb.BinA292]HOE95647.1 acetolactate synthase small subunit [Candidatus Sumerlaeota bacterium]HOR27470.1 acetolactate synthase small subunit [Candidatus Sumerlaeota bacterium]